MFSKVTDTILYIGVNDHEVDLFEGQYIVPNGISYNSYIILDEHITVMDTVDKSKTGEWLDNIEEAICGKTPDYLVVQHMEPDHSASIGAFAQKYPNAAVIGNRQILDMIENCFPDIKRERCLTVEDGESLETGSHALTFVFAPMVHWPEVMMTYESSEKILFSADGFGKFGALDREEAWEDEARRYYIGIVGKYGKQVQKVLKKAAALDIRMICPLHGPVLKENLGKYLALYDKWSGYKPEQEGICLCYTSVYGTTRKAVMLLRDELLRNGAPAVEVYDLARCDSAQAVASAFKYNKLVLATTTYNGEVFPHMYSFLHYLKERNFQNRTVAFMENGSWAPQAAKYMKTCLQSLENLRYTQTTVTILAALNDKSRAAIRKLADELTREYRGRKVEANQIDPASIFKIGYGLYVVTSNDGEKDNGLIVNTIAQVNSGEPALIAVNINKANYSADIIRKTGKLNISVLDETAPFEVFKHFGLQSGRDVDKFPKQNREKTVRNPQAPWETGENSASAGIWSYAASYIETVNDPKEAACDGRPRETSAQPAEPIGSIFTARSTNGLPYLTRYANAYISAEVKNVMDLGTHDMFICQVSEAASLSEERTMTYDYYQRYVKRKPEKRKKGYVCAVCGYLYEGETLPDGYVCPLCKHGTDVFEKL